MTTRWGEFLRTPVPRGHAVQVYEDVSELAGSVADYLAAGFAVGEPAVLVATASHRGLFEEQLAEREWDTADLEATGVLTILDVEETLDRIMDGGEVSADLFAAVVGGAIDAVSDRFPGRPIRAFGEMVDVLCERGRTRVALELEQLWNDLARSRSFSLLCGYRLDLFDPRAQVSPLPGICRAHTHVLPAADVAKLTRAVDHALETVLGPARTLNVYLSAQRHLQVEAPLPQLALMWVSAHMPREAERVLAAARERYAAAAA